MAKGFPVVISEFGTPVIPVDEGAPVASVAENGMGTPITIVDSGAPRATPMVLVGGIITYIFRDGTDGFYFDFSKTDQLFQTVNGGAAADDPGENIALALESHAWAGRTLAEELAAQPELVSNGDFASLAGWAGLSASLVGGEAQITGAGAMNSSALNWFTQTIATARYSFYSVAFDATFISTASSLEAGLGYLARRTISSASNGGAKTNYRYFAQADSIGGGAPWQSLNFAASSTAVWKLDNVSAKLIPGNHGLQATTAAQPKVQTGGLARFDGSDDNLLTTLNPAASFSMMFKGKITSASKIVMGSRATTDTRAFIGTDAAGLLAAGVGADSTTTIKGGSDIRGTTGVGALVYSASGVELYWNGVSVYSGALNGSPNTTIPLRLGAFNDNGTAGAFADADIYYALAIKKALTAAEIAAITNLWGTS